MKLNSGFQIDFSALVEQAVLHHASTDSAFQEKIYETIASDSSMITSLLSHLQSETAEERRTAVLAISKIRPWIQDLSPIVKAIIRVMQQDTSEAARLAAAYAMAGMGANVIASSLTAVLATATQDTSAAIRQCAVAALMGQGNNPKVIDTLLWICQNDASASVLNEARSILKDWGIFLVTVKTPAHLAANFSPDASAEPIRLSGQGDDFTLILRQAEGLLQITTRIPDYAGEVWSVWIEGLASEEGFIGYIALRPLVAGQVWAGYITIYKKQIHALSDHSLRLQRVNPDRITAGEIETLQRMSQEAVQIDPAALETWETWLKRLDDSRAVGDNRDPANEL